MHASLRTLLRQTVTREPYLSVDEWGTTSYGPPSTVRCRIVYRPTVIRTSGRQAMAQDAIQELISTAMVTCVPTGWGPQDRITLPDGSQPVILDVRLYPDETGATYVEKVFV